MAEIDGVVAIAREGRVVTTLTGAGCALASRFQTASLSKNFASTLIMMLVEDGMLDLHEPVTRWVPEAPPSWRAMTLHHLLSNSSGIGHWKDVPGLDPSTPASRDERLGPVLRAPLRFEPGTQFGYSSPAFIVVGLIAERATGTPYAQLLATRIIEPLGLASTVSGAQPADAVAGHQAGKQIQAWDLTSVIGAGDVWSTAEDLLLYAHALAAGTLVSQDSLALMRTQHAPFATPESGRFELTGYGYGHYVGTFDGRPVWLHTGDVPGYKSWLGWLPDNLTVVALSNEDSTRWEDLLYPML